MKRFYTEQNIQKGVSNLTGSQLVVSGVLAGLANGVVSGPVEHIRIREFSLRLSFLITLLIHNANRASDATREESHIFWPMGRH